MRLHWNASDALDWLCSTGGEGRLLWGWCLGSVPVIVGAALAWLIVGSAGVPYSWFSIGLGLMGGLSVFTFALGVVFVLLGTSVRAVTIGVSCGVCSMVCALPVILAIHYTDSGGVL